MLLNEAASQVTLKERTVPSMPAESRAPSFANQYRMPVSPSHSRWASARNAAAAESPAHTTPHASSTVDFPQPFGPTRMVSGASPSMRPSWMPRSPWISMEVIIAPVHDTGELASVVAAQAREPNSGLIVIPETFTLTHRVELTSLAGRHSLPAVYPLRFFAELGGLLSYGIEQIDNFRRAATYADRVLRGTKPTELPVQAPVKLVLVVNLKTAKELELEVPLSILYRADELID